MNERLSAEPLENRKKFPGDPRELVRQPEKSALEIEKEAVLKINSSLEAIAPHSTEEVRAPLLIDEMFSILHKYATLLEEIHSRGQLIEYSEWPQGVEAPTSLSFACRIDGKIALSRRLLDPGSPRQVFAVLKEYVDDPDNFFGPEPDLEQFNPVPRDIGTRTEPFGATIAKSVAHQSEAISEHVARQRQQEDVGTEHRASELSKQVAEVIDSMPQFSIAVGTYYDTSESAELISTLANLREAWGQASYAWLFSSTLVLDQKVRISIVPIDDVESEVGTKVPLALNLLIPSAGTQSVKITRELNSMGKRAEDHLRQSNKTLAALAAIKNPFLLADLSHKFGVQFDPEWSTYATHNALPALAHLETLTEALSHMSPVPKEIPEIALPYLKSNIGQLITNMFTERHAWVKNGKLHADRGASWVDFQDAIRLHATTARRA